MSYDDFLANRTPLVNDAGFEPYPMNDCMTGFRAHVAEKCIRRGRSAAFLDTGLGKTSVELEFANQCHKHTGKKSLILTPLAVARQMERDWEDMKMKDYYEKEIVSMIDELQEQRQDRVDTLKEIGYGC